MRAGKLPHMIRIETPAAVADSAWGTPAAGETFSLLAMVWARVEFADGAESESEGVAGKARFAIETRYVPSVTTRERIVWRGKTMSIVSADDPDGSRRRLKIVAFSHPARA